MPVPPFTEVDHHESPCCLNECASDMLVPHVTILTLLLLLVSSRSLRPGVKPNV